MIFSFPKYTDGEVFPEHLLGGENHFGDKTQIQLVKNTTAEAFLNYTDVLESTGLHAINKKTTDIGIFYTFLGNGINLYGYFTNADNQAVFVASTDKYTASDIEQKNFVDTRGDSQFMQFGLYYSDMIKGTTADCGMGYLFRLRDNSLIMIDGGELEQCTEVALEEWMKRACEMTGQDKLHIALWYCSHAHDDHFDFFVELIKKYGDRITVDSILYNFPDESHIGLKPYVAEMKNFLRENLSHCKFLRAHTGQELQFANATLDVLLTHEDMFFQDEDNDYYAGVNSTSTIIKVTLEGKSFIFLADVQSENGDVLNNKYGFGKLSCDYLQAAHHCINHDENIYSSIKADTILIPACRYITYSRHMSVFEILCKYYDEHKFIMAGDCTQILTLADGEITDRKYYPIKGHAYP